MWTPISAEELADLVQAELRQCTPAQAEAFSNHRVPFYQVPIPRGDATESVFVIAHLQGKVLYYEDVEDGFELSALSPEGAIASPGYNQFELRHVLSQLGF
ncbi:hypothetical protein ACQ859_25170 [Roseateles chitinivorans]|uniref:hypothetical protein n=1 Tax=Roseateles chitinivorans TaxID=2917965 RepID=UPI003D671081